MSFQRISELIFQSKNFLENIIPEEQQFVLAETFSLIYGSQDLHAVTTSDENFLTWFFWKYLILKGKLDEMIIVQERQLMELYL